MVEERDEKSRDTDEKCRTDLPNRMQNILEVSRIWHKRHWIVSDERNTLNADIGVDMEEG